MSLGIAFEGCACRATFQVGAVRWFAERGVHFAATGGSSAGAIVAAGLATDRLEALERMWTELADTPLYRPRRLLRGRWPYVTSHVVRDALQRGFGDLRLAAVPTPLVVTVSQLRRRGVVSRVLTQADDVSLARAVRASCYIPGPYSRMVPIHRRITFDGAWKVRTPVDEVAALGASRVLAVVSDPSGRLRQGGLRSSGPLSHPRVDHRVLAPLGELPVRGFDMDERRVRRAIQMGRDSAEAFARDSEAWLAR